MPEQLGPLLVRLRMRNGLSQARVAERLCEVSRMPTVSRHEVSRWERQVRVPSRFWLGWLATVLEVPLAELEAATSTRADATMRQTASTDNGDPLSRLSISFEHRKTVVTLSATYDDPRRASSAITMFRSMIGAEPVEQGPAGTPAASSAVVGQAAVGVTRAAQASGRPASAPRRQPAVRNPVRSTTPASVPMGIRYKASPQGELRPPSRG